MDLNVIKTLTVRAQTEGTEQAALALAKVSSAIDSVAVISDKASKATLGQEAALKRLQMSLDPAYRSATLFSEAQTKINLAFQQGLIPLQRQLELLDMAQTKYGAPGFFTNIGNFVTSLKGLVSGIGAYAAFDAVMKIHAAIDGVVQSASGLVHVADTLGTTTKNIQELQFAGGQFGLSTDTMNSALEKFSKNLGQAATGAGPLAKILKDNHVLISGDIKKDFENYANLIQNATNAEDKNLLVTTALGKNAEEMGGLFDHGAIGIANFADQADRVGAVITDDQLRKVDDLNKKWAAAAATFGTLFKNAVMDVVLQFAALQDQVTGFLAWLEAHKQTGTLSAGYAAQVLAWLSPSTAASQATNFLIGQGVNAYNAATAPPSLAGASAGPMLTPDELARRQATATLRGEFGVGVPGATTGPGGIGELVPGSFTSRFDTPTVLPAAKAPATAFDQALKSAEKQNQQLQIQITTFGQATAAAARYQKEQELLNAATDAGIKLSPDEKKHIEEISDAYAKETEQLKRLNDQQQAQQFLAQGLYNILDGLLNHTTTLSQAFGNLAKQIAQAVLQAELLGQGPLAGILGTSGGGGGLLGGLVHAAMGAFGVAHSGGVLGVDGLQSRFANPAVFAGAQRFHMGGLPGIGPDEVPIIAKLGEEILRRDDPRHRLNGGGLGAVHIGAPVINIAGDASERTVDLIRQALQAERPKTLSAVQQAISRNDAARDRSRSTTQ